MWLIVPVELPANFSVLQAISYDGGGFKHEDSVEMLTFLVTASYEGGKSITWIHSRLSLRFAAIISSSWHRRSHRHMPILCTIHPQTSELNIKNANPKINTINDDRASTDVSWSVWILASKRSASKMSVGTVMMATKMSMYGFLVLFCNQNEITFNKLVDVIQRIHLKWTEEEKKKTINNEKVHVIDVIINCANINKNSCNWFFFSIFCCCWIYSSNGCSYRLKTLFELEFIWQWYESTKNVACISSQSCVNLHHLMRIWDDKQIDKQILFSFQLCDVLPFEMFVYKIKKKKCVAHVCIFSGTEKMRVRSNRDERVHTPRKLSPVRFGFSS